MLKAKQITYIKLIEKLLMWRHTYNYISSICVIGVNLNLYFQNDKTNYFYNNA